MLVVKECLSAGNMCGVERFRCVCVIAGVTGVLSGGGVGGDHGSDGGGGGVKFCTLLARHEKKMLYFQGRSIGCDLQ